MYAGKKARVLILVCVCVFRQLKEAAEDVRYRKRYQLVFGALLSVVGAAMRREFSKQEDLVKMLAAIAEKVKAAKDKEVSGNVLLKRGAHHTTLYNQPLSCSYSQLTTDWRTLYNSTVALFIHPISYSAISTYM